MNEKILSRDRHGRPCNCLSVYFSTVCHPDPAGFVKLEQSASESLCKILSYISKADIRSLTSSENREYFELA